MNVLITGGYGFIGAWIIKALLTRGDSVCVYDLKEDPRRLRMILPESELEKVAFTPGDVCDLAALSTSIAARGVTHIIHLAGLQVPSCRMDPVLGANVNVLGTLAVFEAARSAKIERVVYASSAAVYGPQTGSGSLPEDSRLVPGTHYGVFKQCNEGNARIYFQDHGLCTVGLRPWTVYGVGRDLGMTSEPTKAIKATLMNRPYAISFGGQTDFQYVADVAATFLHCLDRPYHGAKSYNLRGTVTTLADFRDTLIRVLPAAERLVTIGDTQIAIAYDLSDAALEQDLGPMPKTPLEAGVRQTAKMFEQLLSAGHLDARDLDAERLPAITVEA